METVIENDLASAERSHAEAVRAHEQAAQAAEAAEQEYGRLTERHGELQADLQERLARQRGLLAQRREILVNGVNGWEKLDAQLTNASRATGAVLDADSHLVSVMMPAANLRVLRVKLEAMQAEARELDKRADLELARIVAKCAPAVEGGDVQLRIESGPHLALQAKARAIRDRARGVAERAAEVEADLAKQRAIEAQRLYLGQS